MKITALTLTGADDSVDPLELAKLSQSCPLIEWAILFSGEREGTSRYPSKEWRKEFYNASPHANKAAHLCGKEMLGMLVNEDVQLVEEMKEYERIQLNFNAKRMDGFLLQGLIDTVGKGIYFHKTGTHTKFITQYNEANADVTKLFDYVDKGKLDIHRVLFDASGGLGKSPDNWPAPLPFKQCGYAGGLGPDNISQELAKIAFTVGVAEVWIDMESKLRTNEVFDLDKVREVVSAVQQYIR